MKLTEREIEILDGLISYQKWVASRHDPYMNVIHHERKGELGREQVALLEKIKAWGEDTKPQTSIPSGYYQGRSTVAVDSQPIDLVVGDD